MHWVPSCSGLVSSTSQQPVPWLLIFPARKQLGDQLLERGGKWGDLSWEVFPLGLIKKEEGNGPGTVCLVVQHVLMEEHLGGFHLRQPQNCLPVTWRMTEKEQRSRSPPMEAPHSQFSYSPAARPWAEVASSLVLPCLLHPVPPAS